MTKTQNKIAEMAYINPDFFSIISCLDKRFKIIDYLLKNTNGEYCIATQKEIATKTELSISCVRTFLKTLEKNNLLIKHSQGIYKLCILENED